MAAAWESVSQLHALLWRTSRSGNTHLHPKRRLHFQKLKAEENLKQILCSRTYTERPKAHLKALIVLAIGKMERKPTMNSNQSSWIICNDWKRWKRSTVRQEVNKQTECTFTQKTHSSKQVWRKRSSQTLCSIKQAPDTEVHFLWLRKKFSKLAKLVSWEAKTLARAVTDW